MSETQQATPTAWTSTQAYILAVICLLAGIAVGWLLRGSGSPGPTVTGDAASATAPPATAPQVPPAVRLKEMADTKAAPLIEQLKSDPNNVKLLVNIGNIYYDAQQYPNAIEYYRQVLKLQPANTDVRSDMATAYWYSGNADTAIEEFRKTLSYEPNKANALFNLGVVQWQGKMDAEGALATWQKLLDTSPNYQGKDKVMELMAEAKRHIGVKPGTPGGPLAQ
jgi:cytochrome c-type biogenesis protein CcmH/NrfG